jgi:hypothetical protein
MSYRKNIKNHALKSAMQISAAPNKYCNFITYKMGKTWKFIFATVDKLRACLFGLSVAGCAGKAAVEGKLLCRESCCSVF